MPRDGAHRLPVGAEAAGEVRLLRQRLRADALALSAAAWRIPDAVIVAATFKTGTGAERAWSRIFAAMPCPPHIRQRHVALWRLLRPGPAIMVRPDGTDLGDQQIVASWLAIGRSRGGAVRRESVWGLSFSDHAIARLLERTGFRVDPVATMQEAHDALLAASSAVARTMLAERRWAIPAGPGAFLGTMRALTDADAADAVVLTTAETWVAADQLWPEQIAQVAAIRFRGQEPGRTLGDGLLQPSVLRPLAPPQTDASGQFARLPL